MSSTSYSRYKRGQTPRRIDSHSHKNLLLDSAVYHNPTVQGKPNVLQNSFPCTLLHNIGLTGGYQVMRKTCRPLALGYPGKIPAFGYDRNFPVLCRISFHHPLLCVFPVLCRTHFHNPLLWVFVVVHNQLFLHHIYFVGHRHIVWFVLLGLRMAEDRQRMCEDLLTLMTATCCLYLIVSRLLIAPSLSLPHQKHFGLTGTTALMTCKV
jgi:hypothetical protein